VEVAVTRLDQLRLRLPDHEFDRLMQAAKPVAEPDRNALLKDIAAELGQHEVVRPGLLHRIISEVQQRYDVADQAALRRNNGKTPVGREEVIQGVLLLWLRLLRD
jgi:hypothetical protein